MKLYVIGDSFSVAPGPEDTTMTWSRLAAQHLEQLHGEPVEVVNHSIMGASQDYCWMVLHRWMDEFVTADDYVIVALTHPSRYWFVDELPELSNTNIIDFEHHCSPEHANAIEMFVRHIQRPRLDTLSLVNRLAYLGYYKLKKNLRRPLVIKCFKQELEQADRFDDLNIAEGSLYEHIQFWEFVEPENVIHQMFFGGVDLRYNHMCLRNHAILGKNVADALYNDTTLDLTTGYLRNFFSKDLIDNEEFRKTELDQFALEERRIKGVRNAMRPWKERLGLA